MGVELAFNENSVMQLPERADARAHTRFVKSFLFLNCSKGLRWVEEGTITGGADQLKTPSGLQ